MHSFNTPLTCSRCQSHDNYRVIVDSSGQGIRCIDCLHTMYVVTHQTPRHKKRFKDRMQEAWDKMTNREEF